MTDWTNTDFNSPEPKPRRPQRSVYDSRLYFSKIMLQKASKCTIIDILAKRFSTVTWSDQWWTVSTAVSLRKLCCACMGLQISSKYHWDVMYSVQKTFIDSCQKYTVLNKRLEADHTETGTKSLRKKSHNSLICYVSFSGFFFVRRLWLRYLAPIHLENLLGQALSLKYFEWEKMLLKHSSHVSLLSLGSFGFVDTLAD